MRDAPVQTRTNNRKSSPGIVENSNFTQRRQSGERGELSFMFSLIFMMSPLNNLIYIARMRHPRLGNSFLSEYPAFVFSSPGMLTRALLLQIETLLYALCYLC